MEPEAAEGGSDSQSALVRWLCLPRNYPHQPQAVEHLETHISHLFLAGPLVYKLKKPCRFDFLDFLTVERREAACRGEVRLNRRLAPDAYLGVVRVSREGNAAFGWDGPGPTADWLVEMRRLPTDRTLDELLRRGLLQPAHVGKLGAVLNAFYQSLTPLAESGLGYRDRFVRHVQGNRRELLSLGHHLPRGLVERVHGFQLHLLHLRPMLLDARVDAGRIVEGHGDLRPEHICLADPIVIFDCVEFSEDFRRMDVADEFAFLAAECDFLGADWVGPQLFAEYAKASGDHAGPVLIDFYKCYRACVRAKVAALRAAQLSGLAQQDVASQALRHLVLADRYAKPWLCPLVVVVGGLSGTGKSTLAAQLADVFGAEHLRTDVVRQQMWPSQETSPGVDAGMYRPELRARVYEQLLQQARQLRAEQVPLILDGTFATADLLRQAQSLVAVRAGLFLAVECVCRPEVARARIRQRLAVGQDPSQARPEVHFAQERHWQAWPPELPWLRVDTEQPLTQQVAQVLNRLRQRAAELGRDAAAESDL